MRWKEDNINFSSGTYSIIDRADFLNYFGNYAFVIKKNTSFSGDGKIATMGSILGYVSLVKNAFELSNTEFIVSKDISSTSSFGFYAFENAINEVQIAYAALSYKVGTQGVLLFDSGFIKRREEAYSEYFQLDVYSTATLIQPYYFSMKTQSVYNVVSVSSPTSTATELKDVTKGETSNPSFYNEDNPVDICVGDIVPPAVSGRLPIAYSYLNNLDDSIDFYISDSVGGVKASSLYITISGSTSIPVGGCTVLEAGVPTVSGAFLTGDINTKHFIYTPEGSWPENEIVYITVTGSDNVPVVEDVSFSCIDGRPNYFTSSWWYKVYVNSDITSSIVAIADSTPPYLDNVSPVAYSGINSATSVVSFIIKDDYSGVNINTIYITIDGLLVVEAGTIKVSGASLVGDKNAYYFIYTVEDSFLYGTNIIVTVRAYDLYTISPNLLDITYYFGIVSSDSLRIENFYPDLGVTWNPELIDISVDVIDEIYDIDESDLYIRIKGVLCSPTISNIYGNRSLTTSVSGITSISETSIDAAYLKSAKITGTSIVGSTIFGGAVVGGTCSFGFMSDFCSPFSFTPISSIIAAYFYEGVVISGTLETTLVSGVNWDGAFVNSTIENVDITSFYSTLTSSIDTVISGTVGRTLTFHPSNDFNYEGGITVLVHGKNLSSSAPVVVEGIYNLYHGYSVKNFDSVFDYNKRVNVGVHASNTFEYNNDLNYGYYFNTISQQNATIGATIEGIAPWVDLSATIYPQAPVHRYGQTMEIEIYVEDFDGNAMGPYTFYYTIEQAPE
jgi:hypothetical protein